MNNTLTKSKYIKLATDLKRIILDGQEKTESLFKQQLCLTYWSIGQRIAKEKLTKNSNYRNSIFRDLSQELKIDPTILGKALRFYQTYSSPPKNLSWSHYRELITVKDEGLRLELEHKAQENNWSRDKLTNAIKIQKSQTVKSNSKLVRPQESSYVYKAVIDDVIDGDTLILKIDLGFQVHKEQRVRLAGLDCPEMDSKEGKKAFEYVRQEMANLDYVIIKTEKIDMYGRYLGHIFYDPNNLKTEWKKRKSKKNERNIFKTGNYLNQELINEGLAKIL